MLGPRIPFHRHLAWLCLEDLEDAEIKKYYDNIQFAEPQLKHFTATNDFVHTIPTSPATLRRLRKKVYSEDDRKFWARYGFEEIYLHRLGQSKANWPELGKILNHPVMRVALECCLVARVLESEISQLLPAVFGLDLTEPTIALFKKYFFDVEVMDRHAWRDYLHLIAEDRYSYTRLIAALTKPREEVMHLVGLPTKVQFGTMLKNLMHTAHYKFEYYSRQQSPEAQAEARNWAKILVVAGEKHEKFGVNDATDFSTLIQTEFEYIDAPLETVSSNMIAEIKPQLAEAEKKGAEVPVPTEAQRAQLPPDHRDA